MIKVGIIGGSGFTGSSLIELLKNHPNAKIEIVTSTSYSGKKINEIYPEITSDLYFSEL
ncbi:MAG: N-acetyl-gamma-glutamyl-phosphate reductase, partial [Ignavibacteriales bacterium]|nr:N-acetyl-gamma-glutamyl-phosphate reductase [Ignavibacteriales bacterium]